MIYIASVFFYIYGVVFCVGLNPRLQLSVRERYHFKHSGRMISSSPLFYSSEMAISSFFKCVNSSYYGVVEQFKWSVEDAKKNPSKYLSIPISSAIIGYFTNWIGVKMLFYPIRWVGIPFYRIEGQPLGLIGWQGIVPAKRVLMSNRLVDVTLSKLISIPEIFRKLDPSIMASLIAPSLKMFTWFVPSPIIQYFLKRTCKDVITQAADVIDLKTLVVRGLTQNPAVLGQFFQKVARKELNFLVDSGLGLGFALGLVQMLQWMIYPKDWTLIAGGALVGYVTNWIALKWIFEPLEPVRVGPWMIQGMFLKRQQEVSVDFCSFLCNGVIVSKKVWEMVLDGPKTAFFKDLVSRSIPLPDLGISMILEQLRKTIGNVRLDNPLHVYIDKTLGLQELLTKRMSQLSSADFEQIIHPIFQEDETTLILAGAVLGAISGLLQVHVGNVLSKRSQKKSDEVISEARNSVIDN